MRAREGFSDDLSLITLSIFLGVTIQFMLVDMAFFRKTGKMLKAVFLV